MRRPQAAHRLQIEEDRLAPTVLHNATGEGGEEGNTFIDLQRFISMINAKLE